MVQKSEGTMETENSDKELVYYREGGWNPNPKSKMQIENIEIQIIHMQEV